MDKLATDTPLQAPERRLVTSARAWRFHYVPRRMAVLFAFGLLAIVVDALLFNYVASSLARWTQEGIELRGQMDELDGVHDALIDAEAAARAFLLSGRSENSEAYATASARASRMLSSLQAIPHSDPSEQAQAEQYGRLARSRLDELNRIVEAYREGKHDPSLQRVATDRTKIEQIQSVGGALEAALTQRVASVRARLLSMAAWAKFANAAAALIATGILVFFGLLAIRHLIRRQRLERRIQTTNIELERMVAERTRELEESAASVRAKLSHREQHEQMLRESEERFRLLVAGVKDYAIFRLDPQGTITSWNAGAERIKGYAADEIIGRHFSIFYTAQDREAGTPQRALETAAREGKYEAEAVRVRKDGSQFIANVVIDALRDDTGRLVGFAKVTRDVTERHEQQAALEETRVALAQSQKMEALGQLSGGIAHDFNNLLHVIKNATSLLERRLAGEAKQVSEAIGMIQRSVDRAASLTQRLLAFSRRQPLQPHRIEPHKLVRDLEPLLKSALGPSIELQLTGTRSSWAVSADPSQLEIAILNLAVNARDAMPDGGKFVIETTNTYIDEEYVSTHEDAKPGQYFLISVTDTGTGMTPEVMAKAFEPFFTTKQIGQGTGLGLSQVYGFIKQSGGHVAIESEVGRGTTIRLYLPRVTAEAPEVSDQAQPTPSIPAPASETVLLVEDEADVRSFTAEALAELGYRVLTAADAASALAVLGSTPKVDLLLTDVGLPNGVDGRQLVEQARQRWPDLKVLFTTGYARSALLRYGRLEPGIDLMVKPFSEAILATRIRRILDSGPATPSRASIQ